jgi:hypothetical protein
VQHLARTILLTWNGSQKWRQPAHDFLCILVYNMQALGGLQEETHTGKRAYRITILHSDLLLEKWLPLAHRQCWRRMYTASCVTCITYTWNEYEGRRCHERPTRITHAQREELRSCCMPCPSMLSTWAWQNPIFHLQASRLGVPDTWSTDHSVRSYENPVHGRGRPPRGASAAL